MSFIITDNKDESKEVTANAWNWGPTVEIIKQMNILDEERMEMIRFNCATEVSSSEAKAIGNFIQDNVLSKLNPKERITYDLKTTAEPDDGTFHREDSAKNYSATYDWLKTFTQFCLESDGFTVY